MNTRSRFKINDQKSYTRTQKFGLSSQSERGYIALMATIIISLVLLVMAVEQGSSGWYARFNILGTEAKEQASSLAEGCAEQAQAALLSDPTYGSATTTTTTSVGTCSVFPVQLNFPVAGLVTVKTQAVVQGSYANLDMAMNMNDIHFGAIPTAPTTGTLFITTHVINDGSGDKKAADFRMNVSGIAPAPASFDGTESGMAVIVKPGAYSVSEALLPNYAITNTTTDCTSAANGDIHAGEIRFCTITNDDVTTTLTLIANVVNDNNGSNKPADFPLFIDGNPVNLGTKVTVTPGVHTASSTKLSGYAASNWGYDCTPIGTNGSVTLAAGQNKTCVINYDDIPPPAPSCADTVMMLDRTGSMLATDLTGERNAANALVNLYAGVLPPATPPQLGVGVFGDGSDNNGLAPAKIVGLLSTNYASLTSSINSWLSGSEGYTNLSDAINKASGELNSSRHIVNPPAPAVEKKKVIILVSDGDPNRPTGTINQDVTLAPNAEAASTGWNTNTGTKVAAVAGDDGDTTYLTPGLLAQTYGFTNATVPTNATNISVTLHVVAKRASGSSASINLIEESLGDIVSDSGHSLTSNYTDYSWTTNSDPSGNTWTPNEVNGWTTKFGVLNTSSSGNIPRVTQVYLVVNYTIVNTDNVQKSPGSTVSSNQWTNPTRAFASDDSYTTDSVTGHVQGYGNFGFSIPSNAVITGISVTTEAKISGAAGPTNTGTLYPNGQGSQTAWTNGESVIDETGTPSCSSSDSIVTGTTNNRESVQLDLSSIPDGSIISSVDVTSYDKADISSGGTYKTFVRLGSTNFDAGTTLTSNTTGGSSTCNSGKTQNVGLGNITKTSGTSIEVGVLKVAGNSNAVRVGALNAIVNYTPPTVGSLGLALSSNNGGSWTNVSRNIRLDTSESVDTPSGNTPTDLWGRSWVPSDFNNGAFALRVQNNTTNGVTVSLDQVNVTVYYSVSTTPPPSTQTPSSLGNFVNWPQNTGTQITAVATNDGDTTWVSNTPTTQPTETFVFPNTMIPTNATNISVTLHAVAKETNGSSGNIKFVAEKGASQIMDSGHNLNSSYNDYSWSMNNNPLGGSWTVAEVNGWTTRFGIKDNSSTGSTPRITELYLVVSYTVSADPVQSALASADSAKAAGVDVFTIYFGTGNPGLLAELASGNHNFNDGHQTGSYDDPGGITTGSSGPISPTVQSADSGGDGNGFEITPNNAFADGPSGTSGAAQNIDGAGDRHRFSGYAFTIPPGATITGIQTRLDWWLDSTSGTNSMNVELSWDGGTTWTAAKTDTNESTSVSNSRTLGSTSDTWGHSWLPSEFDPAKFRVRVTSNSTVSTRDFYLDWIPVTVSYSVNTENADGDNFFIAPSATDMQSIFNFIGNQVCPAALNLAATPPPTTATVLVMTQVTNNNDNDGDGVTADPPSIDKTAAEFTGRVSNASNPSISSFSGNETGISITLNPGTYTITEDGMNGYVETPGATCSATTSNPIVAGETRVCVLNNDDIPSPPPPPNLNLDPNTWHEVPTN